MRRLIDSASPSATLRGPAKPSLAIDSAPPSATLRGPAKPALAIARAFAVAAVTGSAMLAYASVGNGDVVATTPVTVVTVTSPTGSGSGTATLQNTTTGTSYAVLLGSDATCDPEVTFAVAGGNPIGNFAANTSRNVAIGCPARGSDATKRCLVHATNNTNGTPLVDFLGVCLYGTNTSMTPAQTVVDFASVGVGDFAERTFSIRNDGTGPGIRRVYLTSSDLDGDFQFSTPCNPDGSFCDIDLTSVVPPGGSFSLGVKCRPQSPGMHTAQVYVGTDTFQLLSLGVTLQCVGTATSAPALAMTPSTIEIPSPVEVQMGSASTTVHLSNAGGGTLLVKDVRIVDVDAGAADDWAYEASGDCSGQITSLCMLESGEQVDIQLTFDPSQIGNRHAALLISYRDTIERTTEIPLDAVGLGATLRRVTPASTLSFGMVPVGRMAALDVTLANDGNRDTTATVTLAANSTPPYTTVPATTFTVTPGMPRALSLQCAPAAAGTFMTTATITSPEMTSPITVTATCDGTTQQLYANPTSLQVGEIRLAATAPTVTVQILSTNTGSPLTITSQPQLEMPNAAITLGPLSQLTTPATFAVTVAPQAIGAVNATIVVTTSDGETLRIPIAAQAVDATYIAADTLDLGTFCIDQPTTSSNLTLLSTGTATIELLAPSLAQSPSPFELTHTAPQIYPYMLTPAKAAVVAVTPQRQRTATIVADTLTWRTDVTGAATASTSLVARFIDSGGAIAPPALNFGEATVHVFTTNGQRIVIQNCNPTPLLLDPPNIRTPFTIDSPNFPAMLSPNESVAFSVGFHPTRVGDVMETLRITSPQLPGAPLEVTLVGFGKGPDEGSDAGVGSSSHGDTSFYACSCRSTSASSHPLGVIPLALVALLVLRPRRRTGLRWSR